MEALVIYLVLVASVFASAALSWWVGYQMGREEGAAPSVDDLEALYGPPPHGYGHLGHAAALKHGAPRSLKAAAAGQESPNESKKESTK